MDRTPFALLEVPCDANGRLDLDRFETYCDEVAEEADCRLNIVGKEHCEHAAYVGLEDVPAVYMFMGEPETSMSNRPIKVGSTMTLKSRIAQHYNTPGNLCDVVQRNRIWEPLLGFGTLDTRQSAYRWIINNTYLSILYIEPELDKDQIRASLLDLEKLTRAILGSMTEGTGGGSLPDLDKIAAFIEEEKRAELEDESKSESSEL